MDDLGMPPWIGNLHMSVCHGDGVVILWSPKRRHFPAGSSISKELRKPRCSPTHSPSGTWRTNRFEQKP